MGRRILFVPFDALHQGLGTAGFGYVGKNNAWIEKYNSKRDAKLAIQDDAEVHDITQVFYSPTASRLPFGGLGAQDQIYIRGHCVIGFTGIFDFANRDDQGRDTYAHRDHELCQKLRAAGSSLANRTAALRAPVVARRLADMGLKPAFNGKIKCYNCHSAEGDPNFATALRDALAALHYNSCGIYGYTGALSSMYDGDHKTSTAGGRASQNRVEIRAPA